MAGNVKPTHTRRRRKQRRQGWKCKETDVGRKTDIDMRSGRKTDTGEERYFGTGTFWESKERARGDGWTGQTCEYGGRERKGEERERERDR